MIIGVFVSVSNLARANVTDCSVSAPHAAHIAK